VDGEQWRDAQRATGVAGGGRDQGSHQADNGKQKGRAVTAAPSNSQHYHHRCDSGDQDGQQGDTVLKRRIHCATTWLKRIEKKRIGSTGGSRWWWRTRRPAWAEDTGPVTRSTPPGRQQCPAHEY